MAEPELPTLAQALRAAITDRSDGTSAPSDAQWLMDRMPTREDGTPPISLSKVYTLLRGTDPSMVTPERAAAICAPLGWSVPYFYRLVVRDLDLENDTDPALAARRESLPVGIAELPEEDWQAILAGIQALLRARGISAY